MAKITKVITVSTTGERETIDVDKDEKGVILIGNQIRFTGPVSVENEFNMYLNLLGNTIERNRTFYNGKVEPLISEWNDWYSLMLRTIAPAQWKRDFADRFQKNFLLEEILQDQKLNKKDRKYNDLWETLQKLTKKAYLKLTKELDGEGNEQTN